MTSVMTNSRGNLTSPEITSRTRNVTEMAENPMYYSDVSNSDLYHSIHNEVPNGGHEFTDIIDNEGYISAGSDHHTDHEAHNGSRLDNDTVMTYNLNYDSRTGASGDTIPCYEDISVPISMDNITNITVGEGGGDLYDDDTYLMDMKVIHHVTRVMPLTISMQVTRL